MKTATKPKPKPAAHFPGEWANRQYERPSESHTLILPPPQRRFVHPPGPGKRPGGELWFEGASRRTIAPDKVSLAQMSRQRLALDGSELPMRDVRRGDKWLPWHK